MNYEPRRCEICGKEYIPTRSNQRCCLDPLCKEARKRLTWAEYREKHYESVLSHNRKSMAKKRAEKYLAEHPPKEDTIVAIGYADRQRAETLAMAGKVNTEL